MEYTYILTGGIVGFIIGLTGVGGGSLMTPILIIMFGINPVIAVGTDLLYASITKSSGVIFHFRQGNINWSVVKLLAAGSLPASLITLIVVNYLNISVESFNVIIKQTLSIMLILTAFVIIFKNQLRKETDRSGQKNKSINLFLNKYRSLLTVFSGLFLGVVVTVSSVGAGALGTAILFLLYPELSALRIIASDLAHAVPLTALAGVGHLTQSHVNLELLAGLLLGGVPLVYLGSHLAKNLSETLLRTIMASMLLMLGIKLGVMN
jgi:uncharacterized membrane protein YfcA